MNDNPIKIFMVDDHNLFRDCLSDALKNRGEAIEVVGQAKDDQGLLQKIKSSGCNIILLDIIIPGCDSMDLLKTFKIELPDIPVLVLSSHSEEKFGPPLFKSRRFGVLLQNGLAGRVDR